MSDSVLPDTLSARLLGDTAAFQHDLVLGTEAAFCGVVPTGASVPITVPRAATLTVVIYQGRWARHSTEISCPPVDTDPIGPTEVGIRSNHLTHSLLMATVLLADGMERGWSKDLVAFGKQC